MAAIMPYVAFSALVYLLQATLLRQPSQPATGWARRAYAPWSREEVELLHALMEHGVEQFQIARVLRRGSSSIDYEQQRQRLPSALPHYPRTAHQLCEADLSLLRNITAGPHKLHWRFAEGLSEMYTQPVRTPTLRVIEVSPDPLTAPLRRRGMNDWASERGDADLAVQGVWADIALQLALTGGAVLIPPPDLHSRRRTAIRATLRRMHGQPVPRGAVVEGRGPSAADAVLLDHPQQWDRAAVSGLRAKLVIVVVPALARPPLSEEDPGTSPPPLPHLVRGRVDHTDPWREAVKADFYGRQTWLASIQTGRQLEMYSHEGFSNGAGQVVRLDWPLLRWLPLRGTLLVDSELALVQSAVWYAAVTKRTPDIQATNWNGELPEPLTPAEWHSRHGRAIKDVSERLKQRMLLDLPRWPEKRSELKISVAEARGDDS